MRSLLLVSALALVACANANLLSDGGFETPGAAPGAEQSIPGGGSIGPWDVLGNDVLYMSNTAAEPGNGMNQFNAEEGNSFVDLTGSGNTGPTDAISQSFASVAGNQYTLSFWVGTAESLGPNHYYDTPATIGLSVNGGTAVDYTNPTYGQQTGLVNWLQFTVSVTATANSTSLTFLNATPLQTALAGLDNVDVEAVPEPNPAVAFGLGLGCACLLRCRPRRCV